LIAIGTAAGEWNRLAFTTRTAGAMIYLVLFGSIVGYSAYVYALKHLPISTVSLYAYVNPIIAVLLGAWLLAEPLNMRVVLASILVFAGIAVVRTSHGPASPGRAASLRSTGTEASLRSAG
jgi:drug/metabolite transporter (DMT)-like permease